MDIIEALKKSKPSEKDSEETIRLKSEIYDLCHSNPSLSCRGPECPLHDVMVMCETKRRLGLF